MGLAADQQACSQPFGSNYSVVEASVEMASQCGNKCLRNYCMRWPEGRGLCRDSVVGHLTWIPAHTYPTNQGQMKNASCIGQVKKKKKELVQVDNMKYLAGKSKF